MADEYDAIIIGAGIIGACTAYELAKQGWRTLNLDRLSVQAAARVVVGALTLAPSASDQQAEARSLFAR